MSNVFDDLDNAMVSEFEKAFKGTNVKHRTCILEEGYYTGYIQDFGVIVASNDKAYLRIRFIILKPEKYRGRLTTKWSLIDLDDKVLTSKRLKTDMLVLGFRWSTLRSLGDDERCQEMLRKVVDFKVTKRQKGKAFTYKDDVFRNIWLTRVTGRMTPEEIEQEEIYTAEHNP